MRSTKLELLTAPGTWVGHPTRPRCAEMAKPPGRSDDPVVFTAALTVRRQTVWFLTRLLQQHRAEIGTRRDTRALDAFGQAVLVLRWFADNTRVRQLAADNRISKSTAYDYRTRASTCSPRSPRTCTRHWPRRKSPATPTSTWTARSSTPTGSRPPPERGRPVVVGQAQGARRQHPSPLRRGRLPDLDLRRAPGTRARHHLRPCRRRPAARPSYLS